MREYDRADAAFYDYYSTGLAGDVEFYVEQARQAGGPVLELGCGTGRILLPIADSGVPIVGLDRSPNMLALARKKLASRPAQTRRRTKLVRADMRDFKLPRVFKLILIPYRAFLHLLTPEDQRRALLNIREHLADDGRLILNIFDPRLDLIAEHMGPLGASVKLEDEFIHPERKRHVMVWDSRRYDPERQTVEQLYIFEELDDEGRSLSRTFSSYTLRYIYRFEMEHLFELCGFRVQALLGDFQGGPFRYGAEQIWVVTKGKTLKQSA